jgi:hypothetical protein
MHNRELHNLYSSPNTLLKVCRESRENLKSKQFNEITDPGSVKLHSKWEEG